MSFSLIENAHIVNIRSPIDANGNALPAAFVNMKNCQKVTFIVNLGVLSATSAAAVTLIVANDATPTKSKTIGALTDLSMPHYYRRTVNTDTWVKTAVASSTFNMVHTDDGLSFAIEVDAAKMGMFTSTSVAYEASHVRLAIATPGAHACLMGVLAIQTGLRYAEDTPPTAIT